MATFIPICAALIADIYPPGPDPMTVRSNFFHFGVIIFIIGVSSKIVSAENAASWFDILYGGLVSAEFTFNSVDNTLGGNYISKIDDTTNLSKKQGFSGLCSGSFY